MYIADLSKEIGEDSLSGDDQFDFMTALSSEHSQYSRRFGHANSEPNLKHCLRLECRDIDDDRPKNVYVQPREFQLAGGDSKDVIQANLPGIFGYIGDIRGLLENMDREQMKDVLLNLGILNGKKIEASIYWCSTGQGRAITKAYSASGKFVFRSEDRNQPVLPLGSCDIKRPY